MRESVSTSRGRGDRRGGHARLVWERHGEENALCPLTGRRRAGPAGHPSTRTGVPSRGVGPPHRRRTRKAAGGLLKQLPRPWGLELPSPGRASGWWAGHTGSRQHRGRSGKDASACRSHTQNPGCYLKAPCTKGKATQEICIVPKTHSVNTISTVHKADQGKVWSPEHGS